MFYPLTSHGVKVQKVPSLSPEVLVQQHRKYFKLEKTRKNDKVWKRMMKSHNTSEKSTYFWNMTHTYSIPPHLSMCACGVCTSLQSQWLFHPRRRRKLCSSPAVKRWNLRGQQLSPHWFFAALGCRSHFQVPFPQHLQVFKHLKAPNKSHLAFQIDRQEMSWSEEQSCQVW